MAQPRILLVDDSPDVGLIVRKYGQRAGQEVAVVPHAEAAWTFLEQTWPDLAVLDVNLPGASGPELCRRIRGVPRLAGLPVAILSHWDRPGDILAGLDAGADFFLSKEALCESAAWQARLGEILASLAGRAPDRVLPFGRIPTTDADTLIRRFNLALTDAPVGRLGPDVLALLLRRAAANGAGPRLLAVGLGIDPTDAPLERLPSFLAAFARQLWCVAGNEAALALEKRVAPDPDSPSNL